MTNPDSISEALAVSGWSIDREVGTLIELIRSEDPEVSLCALRALGRIRQDIREHEGR